MTPWLFWHKAGAYNIHGLQDNQAFAGREGEVLLEFRSPLRLDRFEPRRKLFVRIFQEARGREAAQGCAGSGAIPTADNIPATKLTANPAGRDRFAGTRPGPSGQAPIKAPQLPPVVNFSWER